MPPECVRFSPNLAGRRAPSLVWTVRRPLGWLPCTQLDPDLQRKSLAVLENAVSAGEAPAWQFACLADRIAFFEGRPQRYGTQLDWDDEGYHSVYGLEDAERVNELRATVGLGPLEGFGRDGRTPKDSESLRRHRGEYEVWARKVGWRK